MYVVNLNFLIMTKNDFSPEKQLQLIEETIAQAKENLGKHSFPFIFWGWLVSLTALVNHLLLTFSSLGGKSYLIWPISMVLGAVLIVLYYRKTEKTERHLTHLEYFLSRLWIVLGLILLVFTVGINFMDLDPWFFFPFIAGLGTVVSGVVLKFTPLTLGGIVLLAFPFYSAAFRDNSLLLLYAAVIVVSYLIPSYLLKRQSE